MRNPKTVVRRLPPNVRGRDFYVGDIHGYTTLLRSLLEHVVFDPEIDRLISVGDLVDRGPDSLGATKLIDQPWFFAVLGNHELMSLGVFGVEPFELWEQTLRYSEHIDWHWRLTSSDRILVADRLASLPLALEVEQPDGRVFGVIHGEIDRNPGWSALHHIRHEELHPFNPLVECVAKGRNVAEALQMALGLAPFTDSVKWLHKFRHGIQRLACRTLGIDLLICGHAVTAARHPFAMSNRINIETGVFCSPGRMSLVEPRSQRYWQTGLDDRRPDDVFSVREHRLPKPFTAWDVRLGIRKLVAEHQGIDLGPSPDTT